MHPTKNSTASPTIIPSRYERYQAILQLLIGRDAFALSDIKRQCASEQPAYVTRVLNELADEGWLVREAAAPENLAGDRSESEGGLYRWSHRRAEFSIDHWILKKTSGVQITAKPTEERPRERLMENGASSLKNSELIAILIRSGRQGYSAVQAGEDVSKAYVNRLETLPDASPSELKEASRAVANTAYCQIMAGIELGRRIAEISVSREPPTQICSSSDAIAFCRRHFSRLISDGAKEEFHIVCLNTKNQFIDSHQISVGTLDASLVHPREVFRPAIKDSASSILLVHNHPSGDPQPSNEDFRVTVRLESAGELLGIDVLDHVVLGLNGCASIREERN